GGEMFQHGGDTAGDAALHVDGAAAIEQAVLHLAGERAVAPRAFVARRHHGGMAGKANVRTTVADPGIEVFDVRRAGLTEGDAMYRKAGRGEDSFQHAERAGIDRGYR